jgi:hypothetical protein
MKDSMSEGSASGNGISGGAVPCALESNITRESNRGSDSGYKKETTDEGLRTGLICIASFPCQKVMGRGPLLPGGKQRLTAEVLQTVWPAESGK